MDEEDALRVDDTGSRVNLVLLDLDKLLFDRFFGRVRPPDRYLVFLWTGLRACGLVG